MIQNQRSVTRKERKRKGQAHGHNDLSCLLTLIWMNLFWLFLLVFFFSIVLIPAVKPVNYMANQIVRHRNARRVDPSPSSIIHIHHLVPLHCLIHSDYSNEILQVTSRSLHSLSLLVIQLSDALIVSMYI